VAENRSIFLRPLKKKGFKEERVAKVGADDLDNSTTLESNKSHSRLPAGAASPGVLSSGVPEALSGKKLD
jgi:hypothetical protein